MESPGQFSAEINTQHTYWYIEAVPELLELASARLTQSEDGEAGR